MKTISPNLPESAYAQLLKVSASKKMRITPYCLDVIIEYAVGDRQDSFPPIPRKVKKEGISPALPDDIYEAFLAKAKAIGIPPTTYAAQVLVDHVSQVPEVPEVPEVPVQDQEEVPEVPVQDQEEVTEVPVQSVPQENFTPKGRVLIVGGGDPNFVSDILKHISKPRLSAYDTMTKSFSEDSKITISGNYHSDKESFLKQLLEVFKKHVSKAHTLYQHQLRLERMAKEKDGLYLVMEEVFKYSMDNKNKLVFSDQEMKEEFERFPWHSK